MPPKGSAGDKAKGVEAMSGSMTAEQMKTWVEGLSESDREALSHALGHHEGYVDQSTGVYRGSPGHSRASIQPFKAPMHPSVRFSLVNQTLPVEIFVAALEDFLVASGVDLESKQAVIIAGFHLEGEEVTTWHLQFGRVCEDFASWKEALVKYANPVSLQTQAAMGCCRLLYEKISDVEELITKFNLLKLQAVGQGTKEDYEELIRVMFILSCPSSMQKDLLVDTATSGSSGLLAAQAKARHLQKLYGTMKSQKSQQNSGTTMDSKFGGKRRCWVCGQVGHLGKECPNKK